MRLLKVIPRINKKNGQINIALPKKKISKKILEEIKKNPNIKLKLKFEGLI